MPWTYDNTILTLVAGLVGFGLGGTVVWRLGLGASTAKTDAATLRQDHEWFRVTLASIRDGVIAMNAEGKVTFLNAVAESLTGWQQGEARGKPLAEVFKSVHEKTRQTVENPAERALRESAAVGLNSDAILIAKNGAETCIEDNAAPICDENGRVIGVVLVFRDVIERRPTSPLTQQNDPGDK